MHSKIYVSRNGKATYNNLERREYFDICIFVSEYVVNTNLLRISVLFQLFETYGVLESKEVRLHKF
jgi:hypothetical protein